MLALASYCAQQLLPSILDAAGPWSAGASRPRTGDSLGQTGKGRTRQAFEQRQPEEERATREECQRLKHDDGVSHVCCRRRTHTGLLSHNSQTNSACAAGCYASCNQGETKVVHSFATNLDHPVRRGGMRLPGEGSASRQWHVLLARLKSERSSLAEGAAAIQQARL